MDEKKANALYEKVTTLEKEGRIDEAITALLGLNTRSNGPMVTQCFEKACELCLCTADGVHAYRLVPILTRAHNRLRDSQNPENVELAVKTVVKNMRVLFENAHALVEKVSANPTSEEQMLESLSGVSVKKRAHSRYITKCDKDAAAIASDLFGLAMIGLSKSAVRVYINEVQEFMAMCEKYKMVEAADGATKAITDTLYRSLFATIRPSRYSEDTKRDRKDFFESETACTDMVDMLCVMLRQMTANARWRSAWMVLTRLKQLADEAFTIFGKHLIKTNAYEAMAATFWSCSNYTYHALCLCTAAITVCDTASATRAVLAALCCTEVSEDENPFALSANLVHADVAEQFRHPNTSRKALLTKLQLHGVLAAADPAVAKLAQVMTTTSTETDFPGAHKALSALLAANASYAQYDSLLRKAMLNHQLECLATTQNRIDAHALSVKDGALTDDDYLHIVEPAIVENTVADAEVDSKTHSVSLRNATKVRVVSSFVRLASKVSTRPAAQKMTGPSSSPACAKAPAAITAKDLLGDHMRTRTVHALQKECENTVVDRVRKRDEMVVQKRDEKIQERKDLEEKRRDVAKDKQLHKLKTEYMQRERQERYKLVLARLRAKYPGFGVDNALANKKPSEFEDQLTVLLGTFHRRKAEHDDREALRLNLFQRELRAQEIPKRKEYNEKHVEQRRAEQAAARANYLAEHRKEFERRQQSKNVLRAFLKDADVMEEEWRKLTQSEKASKREEQMNRLEAEKERLAAGQ